MALEGILQSIPGLKASADLSAKQYYFVKMSGSFTVTVCAATTDIPVGILQNAPQSGEPANVAFFGMSKVSSDAALSAGALIGTAADGQAAAYVNGTDTTKYVVGHVVGASGAADGLATVLFCCVPNRGA